MEKKERMLSKKWLPWTWRLRLDTFFVILICYWNKRNNRKDPLEILRTIEPNSVSKHYVGQKGIVFVLVKPCSSKIQVAFRDHLRVFSNDWKTQFSFGKFLIQKSEIVSPEHIKRKASSNPKEGQRPFWEFDIDLGKLAKHWYVGKLAKDWRVSNDLFR